MRPLGVYFILCGYTAGLLVPLVWPFGLAWLLAGWLAGAIVPRIWKDAPRSLTWAGVGIAAFLAGIYLQVRQPVPDAADISYLVARVPRNEVAHVWGTLEERPQLTRADRARFRIAVEKVRWYDPHDAAEQTVTASGRLYVTMPLLQVSGLGVGDRAELTGRLYLPAAPTNPGAFDFQGFLAKDGIWAGLAGESIDWDTVDDRVSWLETVRQRIVQAHVKGLGVSSGLLMSAMTLGRWSVDLPYALRDRFTDLGLAHVLAASGFHVGIILTSVLRVAGGSPRFQFGVGSATLLLYSALAGFQPSVCRAAFMGWAGVLGTVLSRRVRSTGTLLAIATLLLLFDPLLVRDLGFQLSFLATFGLIVATAPIAKLFSGPLSGRLPQGWAQAMAVPIAATIWTLPLQIYVFNTFSPLAIPINLVAGELAGVITTVGFFSGLVAIASTELGSAIARGLAYPMDWMLSGMAWIHERAGRPWFVPQIEVWQVVVLYGILVGLWLWGAEAERASLDEDEEKAEIKAEKLEPRRSPRQTVGTAAIALVALATGLGIVFAPAYWRNRDSVQVFILDEAAAPLLVVRDRGELGAIGGEVSEDTVAFTLVPMFRSLGANRLSLVVETGSGEDSAREGGEFSATLRLADRFPVRRTVEVADQVPTEPIAVGRVTVEPLDRHGNLELQVRDRTWLAIGDVTAMLAESLADSAAPVDVVCWSGEEMPAEVWQRWQPETAIAVDRVSQETRSLLAERGVALWETRQGAIISRDGGVQRAVRDRQPTDWLL